MRNGDRYVHHILGICHHLRQNLSQLLNTSLFIVLIILDRIHFSFWMICGIIFYHWLSNYFQVHLSGNTIMSLLQKNEIKRCCIEDMMLKLEEKKLQNRQLLDLIEADIRKKQLAASVKPSINAYLLCR